MGRGGGGIHAARAGAVTRTWTAARHTARVSPWRDPWTPRQLKYLHRCKTAAPFSQRCHSVECPMAGVFVYQSFQINGVLSVARCAS